MVTRDADVKDLHNDGEPHGGIVAGAHRVTAGLDHRMSAGEQRLDVDADQRRGHEAEERQGRVAPADRGGVEEGAAEARFGRELVERSARICDGNEVDAGPRHRRGLDLPAEELVERQGLRRGAGLRGDDEERPRQVEAVEDLLDRRRVGRVDQEQVRVSHLGAEGQVEDIAAERRPPHAQQHDVRELQPPDLVREGFDVVGVTAHDGR